MVTGFFFIIMGVLIFLYPHILVAICSSLLILFGLGMMVASWQFRRLRRQSDSRFINWIIRF